MNDISPFQFEGRNVRLIEVDGETWFVATDVARELGYRDAADLVRNVDADERGTHTVRTSSSDQDMSIISEPGLYRAIVQRRTNKKHDASLTEKISRFQRWVFHDILPAIRKTGRYEVVRDEPVTPALPDFTNPAVAARAWAEQYEGREVAEKKVVLLEVKTAEMKQDVAAFDRIANGDGSFTVTEAAKALQMGPKELTRYLKANMWIYRRSHGSPWLGYQDKVNAGWLIHRVTPLRSDKPDGEPDKIAEQVRVTTKGLTVLAKRLGRDPQLPLFAA